MFFLFFFLYSYRINQFYYAKLTVHPDDDSLYRYSLCSIFLFCLLYIICHDLDIVLCAELAQVLPWKAFWAVISRYYSSKQSIQWIPLKRVLVMFLYSKCHNEWTRFYGKIFRCQLQSNQIKCFSSWWICQNRFCLTFYADGEHCSEKNRLFSFFCLSISEN